MPTPIKPTPESYCGHCETRLERKRFKSGVLESLLHFNRRKYCDRTCMAAAFDARPTRSIDWSTTHYHAKKLVAPGPCVHCGKPDALDVHHKDGDHLNNSLENLERICRSCHMKSHRVRRSCSICGKPRKGLGYCEMHYQRLRKHGDPLAYKVPPRKACRVCGVPANARSLCGRHYMQVKRGRLVLSEKEELGSV